MMCLTFLIFVTFLGNKKLFRLWNDLHRFIMELANEVDFKKMDQDKLPSIRDKIKCSLALWKWQKRAPLGSATVDSCIRVVDNGRESHHRNAWSYQFRGSARWIHSLKDAALNPGKNFMAAFPHDCLKEKVNKRSIDWTAASSTPVNAMTSDVIAPSLWKIFGCQNGLHLFKEPKDRDSNGRQIKKNRDQRRGEEFTFMLEEAPVKDRIHVEVLSTSTRIGLLHPEEIGTSTEGPIPDAISQLRNRTKL
ncbi:hypothetical protein OROHE_010891 [Orobanche hederae]